MNLEVVALTLLGLAAVPAVVFPFAYAWRARGAWWRVPTGRALMVASSATALLLTLEVVELLVPFSGRTSLIVATVVLGVIAVGALLMIGALFHESRRPPPS